MCRKTPRINYCNNNNNQREKERKNEINSRKIALIFVCVGVAVSILFIWWGFSSFSYVPFSHRFLPCWQSDESHDFSLVFTNGHIISTLFVCVPLFVPFALVHNYSVVLWLLLCVCCVYVTDSFEAAWIWNESSSLFCWAFYITASNRIKTQIQTIQNLCHCRKTWNANKSPQQMQTQGLNRTEKSFNAQRNKEIVWMYFNVRS